MRHTWLIIVLCLCHSVTVRAQGVLVSSSYMIQGDSAYTLFENEKALALYEKAFQEDSTFEVRMRLSRTYYDYGLDLMAHSGEDEARHFFEQAVIHARELIALYPDSAQSHFLLAATMGNLAQFENGKQKVIIGRLVEKHSRHAITLDSTLAYPYVSLGIYYRELTQINWIERTFAQMFYGRLPDISEEDVLSTLHHAEQLRPDFPFLHYEIAMTYLLYDDKENAVKHLQTLISLEPETSQDLRNQQNATVLINELTN